MIAKLFFSAIAAIAATTAIIAIIWKPSLIYRNDHPPFLLNCYLYALQTYLTHSSKLRLLLVLEIIVQTLTTKGLQRTANEYVEERRIYKHLDCEATRRVT